MAVKGLAAPGFIWLHLASPGFCSWRTSRARGMPGVLRRSSPGTKASAGPFGGLLAEPWV